MGKTRKVIMASQKGTEKLAAGDTPTRNFMTKGGDLMHPHYVALRNIRKNDDKSTIV